MKENFDRAFELLMEFEGGYSDDLNDAGGKTMYGISVNNFPREFAEISALTAPQDRIDYAMSFYKITFWDPIEADGLPDKLDIAAFDFAVNSGVSRAKRLLQVTTDWRDYIFNRMEFLNAIGKGSQLKFLRGWINRCIKLWKTLREEKQI